MHESLAAAQAKPAPALARKAWTPCWENLNELEWMHGFTFTSHGVTMGVRVNDTSLLEALWNRLPNGARLSSARTVQRYFSVILGGRKPGTRIKTFHMTYLNHELTARSHTLDEVLDSFESWVGLSVAQYATSRVFLHAGAVGWRGRAIILPGKSNSGKSKLVTELVKAGATYYSDEFAPIDKNGHLHPYHKPIGVRDPASGRQSGVSVEEIGGQRGNDRLPIGLVVLSQYQAGARWRPESLTPGKAVLEMLANSISARDSASRVMSTLEGIALSATTVKSPRGEARSAAARILEMVHAS